MTKRSRCYPALRVDTADVPAVGQAGGVLLTDTIAAAGLEAALAAAVSPWRKPLAIHDPGKVVLDLAVTLALGGDCLADFALLRAEPGVHGPVASDLTVSCTIDALAADAPAALKAINAARAAARARVWGLVGEHAPDHAIDASAPLVAVRTFWPRTAAPVRAADRLSPVLFVGGCSGYHDENVLAPGLDKRGRATAASSAGGQVVAPLSCSGGTAGELEQISVTWPSAGPGSA